jgi:hypothetical protein
VKLSLFLRILAKLVSSEIDLIAGVIDPEDRVPVLRNRNLGKIFRTSEVLEDLAVSDGWPEIDNPFKPVVPDELDDPVNDRLDRHDAWKKDVHGS